MIVELDLSTSVVRQAFANYYSSAQIEMPIEIERREFGYQLFGVHGYIRHLSYRGRSSFSAMLAKEVPSDVYCSNGYYTFPTYPMQEKEWLGADLIFDIDGKDLGLPCVSSHTYLGDINIPCHECISASKDHVKRLLDILKSDFGIADSIIYFSGNNGYHIHCNSERFKPINSWARNEIVNYLQTKNIKIDAQVTSDIHRIFRMPGTLSGKSGLLKKRVDNLESFDPFVDACALPDYLVAIKSKADFSVSLNNHQITLAAKQMIELPAYLSVYLILKGLANALKIL